MPKPNKSKDKSQGQYQSAKICKNIRNIWKTKSKYQRRNRDNLTNQQKCCWIKSNRSKAKVQTTKAAITLLSAKKLL